MGLKAKNRIKVTKSGNFRYKGRRVKLAGAHTWDTVIDFDGRATGLKQLAMPEESKGVQPSTRLWAHIEVPRVTLDGPQPWTTGADAKVGPLPFRKRNGKYDLSKINNKWLKRVERVVRRAEKQDIVTGVTMFDGAFNRFFGGDEWQRHPMNPKNNIQGVGPKTVNGVHAKGKHNPYQRLLVRKLAKQLEPYGNVILEAANEPHISSVRSGWQKRIIKTAQKHTDAPVMASYVTRREDSWMRNSGADAFAPASMGRNFSGKGPIVADDDHAAPLRFDLRVLGSAWRDRDVDGIWMMDGMNGRLLRNIANPNPGRDFIAGL